MSQSRAPLDGVTVVEFAGIGPAPFACGLLADLGALVVRIERPGGHSSLPGGLDRLGVSDRLVVELDLKDDDDRAVALSLIDRADIVVEGWRPGVAERLGVGPDVAMERNPALTYVRITGWGQTGPYAQMAGHDINYIGLNGVLAAIGDDRPIPPLNLVGDYAGGALYAVVGALASLVDRSTTGTGRIVDAAMIEGAAALMSPIVAMRTIGLWNDERASNALDGGAPFYRTYETADAEYMAVGALEPAFYEAMLEGLGIDGTTLPDRNDPTSWPELADRFATIFAGRTQAEWCAIFDGTDACVTPVLGMGASPDHPHMAARQVFEQTGRGTRITVVPRMGSERGIRDEASVSDTLVAAGLGPDEADRLEADRAAYWVDVTTPGS